MEPIYTSLDPASYWFLLPLLVAGGLAMVFLILLGPDTNKITISATVAAFVVFLGSAITFSVLDSISSAEQVSIGKERIKLIQDTYGVTISDKAYEDLSFPEKAPEGETFSSYGTTHITIKQDGEIEQTEVTLVWNETEFQLTTAENNSTQLKELKRENGN